MSDSYKSQMCTYYKNVVQDANHNWQKFMKYSRTVFLIYWWVSVCSSGWMVKGGRKTSVMSPNGFLVLVPWSLWTLPLPDSPDTNSRVSLGPDHWLEVHSMCCWLFLQQCDCHWLNLKLLCASATVHTVQILIQVACKSVSSVMMFASKDFGRWTNMSSV